MKVTLVANTEIHLEKIDHLFGWGEEHINPPSSSDMLGEFAGRACYESWNRPNPKTARNSDYVAHILEMQHYSVLEHASATFYVEEVSRSCTHELVRHRHLSFSQRSQRYVDERYSGFVTPETLQNLVDDYPETAKLLHDSTEQLNIHSKVIYEVIADNLAKVGVPRKRAREAARCVLPNAVHTSIVVTGNHRAWRDVISKRWHVAADREICQLAGMILEQLRNIAPHTYQDIPDRPIGS